MQVIAKGTVFYDNRRYREGEEFTLFDREFIKDGKKLVLKAAEQFSIRSMKKVGEEEVELPQAKLGKNEVNIPGYRTAGKGTKIKAKNINPQD